MAIELNKREAAYDVDLLKAHIEKRKQNIATYEKVIQEERQHIERELAIVHELELRQANGGAK